MTILWHSLRVPGMKMVVKRSYRDLYCSGTKTDSEAPPDSETRDSETARHSSDWETSSSDSGTIRPIQKLVSSDCRNYFVGFRSYFVGFRNCFVGFRNYNRRIQKLFSSDSETSFVGLQKLYTSDSETIFHRIQKLFLSDSEKL